MDKNKKIYILNRFLLNPNCLVKIWPSYRIQSEHWKYHISLFIYQETKKQEQNNCYEKGKVFTLPVGWKDGELFPKGLILKLLLAGDTFKSFQLDGILNNFFNGFWRHVCSAHLCVGEIDISLQGDLLNLRVYKKSHNAFFYP